MIVAAQRVWGVIDMQTIKIVLAALLVGVARLFGIRWNPWIAGKKKDKDE